MSPDAQRQHAGFRQAVRGAVLAQAAFDSFRTSEVGWRQVSEAWTRLQRNGKPTPWDGLVGAAASRMGGAADLMGARRRGPPTRDPSTGERRTRKMRPGRYRVAIDAERYYYGLQPGVETPMLLRDGVLTWKYVGQQVFSRSRRAFQPRWHEDSAPKAAKTEDADVLFGVGHAVRVDYLGRRWLLDSVDHDALRDRIRDYDARIYSKFGQEEGSALEQPRRRMQTLPVWDPTPRFMVPQGSMSTACSGDIYNYSTDPLAASDPPTLNERGRTVVTIWVDLGDDLFSQCSGTMVDLDRHILTAAHCLTDDDGNWYDDDDISVCMFGNRSANAPSSRSGEVDCYDVGWNHPSPDWVNEMDSDYLNSDYGIVTLLDKLSSSNQVDAYMALSRASDSTINGTTNHVRGYPGTEPDCTSNDYTGVDPSFDGMRQYEASGKIDSVMPMTVNYLSSGAGGISGGPHYYCPNGSGCDDGYYITGVHSSVWEFLGWGASVGPKASKFRSWVAGYT